MPVNGIRATGVRVRDERGVTVLLALFVLTLTMLILGAVYQAVTADSQGTRNNLDQARAYSAAQAGVAQYTYQLNQNPNYWQTCPSRSNVTVPGSTDGGSTEYYSYAPVVATTAPANDQICDPNNINATMIEGLSSLQPGTFRVAFTGQSGKITRTLVAQFRQPSFLSFIYYTQYETLDPAAIPGTPSDCAQPYPTRGSDCQGPIYFATGDQVNGPLHSEDTLAICGSGTQGPTFGRAAYDDPIEAAGASTEGSGSCALKYTVNNSIGQINTKAPTLAPPPTNGALLATAQSGGYVYSGRTTIVLNANNTMSVTTASAQSCSPYQCPTGASVPWPSNGVIYVSNAACTLVYNPDTANNDYPPADNACGNAYISGVYGQSLTLAADNDIIINGNLTPPSVGLGGVPQGGAMVGLVANNFVRVYHPTPSTCSASSNTFPSNAVIYAAILAVKHSFIVDNYKSGSPCGNLTVYGAIAQKFRGPVGTIGSSGYLKNYNYDDRLAYSEPPYFLNPTSIAWIVSRVTECDTSC
jgi:hypothetical protein